MSALDEVTAEAMELRSKVEALSLELKRMKSVTAELRDAANHVLYEWSRSWLSAADINRLSAAVVAAFKADEDGGR